MPAVSEFTKAKIVTLHQRGMSYGQISTNLGLSKGTIHAIMRKWEHTGTVVSASRFWKKAGVFRGTERGTPELSPKSVPVHEE
jgi:transposase